MPFAFPSRNTLLRTAETLLIAATGSTLFTLAGFPAGMISGALVSVGAAGLFGRPMMIPRALAQSIFVLVGVSLGAAVTPATLKGLATFPLSIAVLALATIVMTLSTTCYLRFVHGWDLRTALFGASPGALAQVMALSAEYGADMRKIAIVQVMRVVVLTIGIPSGLAFFGLTASGGGVLPQFGNGVAAPLEMAILIVVSVALGVILLRLGFPGGLLFGAMLGSSVLHGGGWIEGSLPWWVVACAVVGIGAVTGSRFANTEPRTLLRYLGAAVGSFAVAISVASGFVLLVRTFVDVPIADIVVAYAPGAQDTMMVLALALHLDPVFVGAHHLSRYMLVSVSIPLIVRAMGATPPAEPGTPPMPKPDAAKPQARPTIED